MAPLKTAVLFALVVAVGGARPARAEVGVPFTPDKVIVHPKGAGFLTRAARAGSRWLFQYWKRGPLAAVEEWRAIEVAFSADGAQLAVLESEEMLRIVEVSRLATVRSIPLAPRMKVHGLAGWLPDGKRLLLATSDWQDDRNVVLEVEVQQGTITPRRSLRGAPALAAPNVSKLSPDGRWLAVRRRDAGRALVLWELATDKLVDLGCQEGERLEWSRDSRKLAADCALNLRVFEAAKEWKSPRLFVAAQPGELAFSTRGDRLFAARTASQRSVSVVGTEGTNDAADWIDGLLAWTSDDLFVVERGQQLQLVDAKGRVVESAGLSFPVEASFVAPSLLRLAGGGFESLVDLDSGEVIASPANRPVERRGFRVLGDRRRLLGLAGTGKQRPIATLPNDIAPEDAVSLSPDGRYLLTARGQGNPSFIVDLKQGTRKSLGLTDVIAVEWAADSSAAWAASLDKSVVWSAARPDKPQPVGLRSHEGSERAAWSSKGVLAVANQSALWLWKGGKASQAPAPRLRPRSEQESAERRLEWSSDGKQLTVRSCGNRDFDELQRYDAQKGKPSGKAERASCSGAPEASGQVPGEESPLKTKWRPVGGSADRALQVLSDGDAVRVLSVRDRRMVELHAVDARADGTLGVVALDSVTGKRLPLAEAFRRTP